MFLALVSLSRCGAIAWCHRAAALLPHKVVLQALSLITRQSACQTFLSLNSHYENDGFHCTALCWRVDDHQLNMRISVTSVVSTSCAKSNGHAFLFLFCFGATWISNKHENREGDSISKLVNTYIIFCVKCLIDSFGLYASFYKHEIWVL